MLSMSIRQLDPPEFAARVPERLTMIKEQGFAVFESAHIRKDGTVMPVEVNSRVLDYEGKRVYFSVIRDITERKHAEEQVKKSLKEKEALLQEIHHRVKNNMQVISSLLKLQSRYAKDLSAEQTLLESQNRVRTMALIHDKLYQSGDLSKIDFGDYVRSLINELLRFAGEKRTKIDISMDFEDIYLSADTAIPCGLIINEMFTNSIKHAFPEQQRGNVTISLSMDASGEYHLVYSDNGIGIPEDVDFRSSHSLGLELIILLAEHQLRGSVELDRGEGTRFDIRFRELRYKERI
jgi:two-component sensor histidine kinase